MLFIMLTVMELIYENKPLNIGLLIEETALIGIFWMLLQTQTGVGNQQFCDR